MMMAMTTTRTILFKAIQTLLLSAGLISILLMAKRAVDFSTLLWFRDSVRCFMSSSLYICIIVNSMVALIAALSTFYPHQNDKQDHDHYEYKMDLDHGHHDAKASVTSTLRQVAGALDSLPNTAEQHYCIGEDDLVVAHQGRKKVPHSEGKMEADQVTDSGHLNEAMDETWKAITGGGKQSAAKTKHLNKSETWPPPRTTTNEAVHNPRELNKSETFKQGRELIRRDPSIGVEELNKQVEAFIHKFNQDMRLQRQESDQRFLDMINRGL